MKSVGFCPCCNNEVSLNAEMKVQKCPECRENILPCSYCIGIYSDCIKPCPLNNEMKTAEAMTKFANFGKPTRSKKY